MKNSLCFQFIIFFFHFSQRFLESLLITTRRCCELLKKVESQKKMISLNRDLQISLCVIYSLGAVASIWAALLSPYIFDWLDVEFERKSKGRNWPKRFLISLVAQPLTFAAVAVGLWWVPLLVIIPPIHFFATIFCLIVIDVTRKEAPWEKGYQRLF